MNEVWVRKLWQKPVNSVFCWTLTFDKFMRQNKLFLKVLHDECWVLLIHAFFFPHTFSPCISQDLYTNRQKQNQAIGWWSCFLFFFKLHLCYGTTKKKKKKSHSHQLHIRTPPNRSSLKARIKPIPLSGARGRRAQLPTPAHTWWETRDECSDQWNVTADLWIM